MKHNIIEDLRRRFHGKIGIRWGIFAGFAFFTVVIIILLWVFQIALLESFYRSIKIEEIQTTGQSLVEQMEQSNMNIFEIEEVITQEAEDKQLSILLSDSSGQWAVLKKSTPDSFLERLTWIERAQIYMETEAAGGEYLYAGDRDNGQPDNLLYVLTFTAQEGQDRMLILNTSLTPVESTVETLKIQLSYLTVVMILLALLLALFIARRISEPIRQINESAKTLATGEYAIEFQDRGFREIAELGATLQYAAGELSKVEQLRRDLIANVSHDLRTPLTMIAGYSEVMRDIPGENTPENVQIIIDETNRLTTLVNDMLDLSKLQAGAIPLESSVFNLTESIREIMARYDKMADFHFTFEAKEEVFVNADELKISQVVYNLVNNAINYTGADKTVRVRQRATDKTVRVEVIDSGEGIEPDKLRDIWERYYKVDKSHKRAQVGSGLGLSIVKSILELHGGLYGVQSQVGKGSIFWFELERCYPKQEEKAPGRLPGRAGKREPGS